MEVSNKTNLIILLWNISKKADSLWIRWIQAYYVKKRDLMEMDIKTNDSWIMKTALNQRNDVVRLAIWDNAMESSSFNMNKVYRELQNDGGKVDWRNLIYGNNAIPKACFILWLTCHERLATKKQVT